MYFYFLISIKVVNIFSYRLCDLFGEKFNLKDFTIRILKTLAPSKVVSHSLTTLYERYTSGRTIFGTEMF